MSQEIALQGSLRVGVTGHRLARLGGQDLDALRSTALGVLATIGEKAAALGASECCLVTNLADGADSIFADEALSLGWPLDAVLPFPRDDYAADYAEGLLASAFARQLGKARAVFELPGVHDGAAASPRAYERAGRVVIAQCDMLIGVWDGQPAAGRGGAAQILAEAVDRGVPVILIDPAGVVPPQLLWDGLEEVQQGEPSIDTVARGSLDRLDALMAFLLNHTHEPTGARLLADFEADRPVRGAWLGLAYPLLLRLFGKGGDKPVNDRPEALAATMLDERAAAALREPFGKADRNANAAARLFRSGYVCNFALAALAVLLSMMGLALPPAFKPVLIVLEVLTIGAILIITRLGNRWHWHRRWLDNRHLAERLRCLEVSVQLGDLDLRSEVAQHSGWAGWFARGAARRAGLPGRVVDGAYLETVKASLLRLLDEQIAYLEMDAHRMHRVEHRLHRLGTWLFGTTAAVCVVLLAIKLGTSVGPAAEFVEATHPLITAGTILSAVLPAIGAAIYGIRMQGDFAGTAERNEALSWHLSGLRQVVASDPADFDSLQRRSRRVTDLLT